MITRDQYMADLSPMTLMKLVAYNRSVMTWGNCRTCGCESWLCVIRDGKRTGDCRRCDAYLNPKAKTTCGTR